MSQEYDYVRILKQLIVSYLINIIVFIIAPLGTFVLSRGLSVADFGVYALFFTVWNLGLQGLPLGLTAYIQNYLPGRSVSEQQAVVRSIFKSAGVLALLFVLMWFLGGASVLVHLNLQGYYAVSWIVLCAVVVSALATIPHAWISARHELEFAYFLYGINSSLWIMLSVLEFFVVGKIKLWHVFLYWVGGGLLQFSLNVWKLGKDSFFLVRPVKEVNAQIIWKGLVFGFPLLLVAMNQWVFSSFDRFFLNVYHGKEAVGLYALMYALVSMVSAFGSFVTGILYPYIAKAWNRKDVREYETLWNAALKYTLLMVIPGSVGVYVLRESLVTLIASAKFLAVVPFIKYIILFPLLFSVINIVQIALVVREKSLQVAAVYVIGITINYVLNAWLVPLFGIKGAAFATILTYGFMAGIIVFAARKVFFIKWRFLKLSRMLLAAVMMGALLGSLHPATVVTKIGVILLGVIVYGVMGIVLKLFGKDEVIILKTLVLHPIIKKFFT